eukprot:CAMPEP_0113689116 /NCGR_PEP_ID=MMETSP0038_2-20120614/16955_1 /TAXON_ID=2898 /ORGANISM="Cryptomonas paramecium" /LENGTH=178 /DNA_ID=CAMNT_0000610091 /DNA_START=232 /DNA_END=764 /DNA_ORIENTATION=+ /assembly_acc=CAM_ASM_000170
MVSVQKQRQVLLDSELSSKYITASKLTSPLDPLLSRLAQFNSSSDLTQKIVDLFLLLDENESGSLSYEEIMMGLDNLEGCAITLSLEDLDAITESKALCNANGELDLQSFDRVIRNQLQLYVQRALSATIEKMEMREIRNGSFEEQMCLIFFVLKMLVANLDSHKGIMGGAVSGGNGG